MIRGEGGAKLKHAKLHLQEGVGGIDFFDRLIKKLAPDLHHVLAFLWHPGLPLRCIRFAQQESITEVERLIPEDEAVSSLPQLPAAQDDEGVSLIRRKTWDVRATNQVVGVVKMSVSDSQG